MGLRLVPAFLAMAAGWLAAPAGALGYSLEGDPWPERTIRYAVSAPRYSAAVNAAAWIWNRSGVDVRFVRADEYDADVVIGYGGRPCDGSAAIGYHWRGVSEVSLGRGCDTRLIRLVAVHELGHVLGLGHEPDRCSRMNPTFDASGTPSRCALRRLSAWLDTPLLGDDLRGARALYGAT